MTATRFHATCTRIEAPDLRRKDGRVLTPADVVHEDLADYAPGQRHITHNVCDWQTTDRDEWVAHMRDVHGVRMAAAPKASPVRARRVPAQTAHDPRPLDPGAWVEWEQDGTVRRGQVWAQADKRHVWVIPVELYPGETYATVETRELTPLGHAVPQGLFGDDAADVAADTGARVEACESRTFADAAEVKAHWAAGGDDDAVSDMPVLALTAGADMIVAGGLVAVKGSREWTIRHAGSGKALHSTGHGPRTKRAAVEALRLLSLLPVPWGASCAVTVAALQAGEGHPGVKMLSAILSGVAREADVVKAAALMAPSVAAEAPVEADAPAEAPDVAPVAPVTVSSSNAPTVTRVPAVAPIPDVVPALTVTGYSREVTRCDRCSLDHRKGTVTVAGVGGVARYGLACAAVVLGLDAAKVKARAMEAQRAGGVGDELSARRQAA